MNSDLGDWQILDVRLVLQLHQDCNAEFLHPGEAGFICEIMYLMKISITRKDYLRDIKPPKGGHC